MKQIWRNVTAFWLDEEGIGTLEMVLIIAVILVIALFFRKWIIAWFENIITKTNDDMNSNMNSDLTLCADPNNTFLNCKP